MPKYTLNYFPLTARGEPIRLMFVVAGVEYTDNHLAGEEWSKVKNDTTKFPLKQMPTLEVDGKVICQSYAIFRFLANELGLYGSSNMDKAIADQAAETINEMFTDIVQIMFISKEPEEKKAEMFKELFTSEKSKLRFELISNILKNSNGKFLLGDKITYPDILFFSSSEFVSKAYPTALDNFPDLKELIENVGANENIKKHIAARKY